MRQRRVYSLVLAYLAAAWHFSRAEEVLTRSPPLTSEKGNKTMLLKLLFKPGFPRSHDAIEGIFFELRGNEEGDDRNDTILLRPSSSFGAQKRDPEIMEHVLRTQTHKLKAKRQRKRRRRRRRHHRKRKSEKVSGEGRRDDKSGKISKGRSDQLSKVIREDWCTTVRMRQTINSKGCLPAQVENHLCYGQCNSFYIPKVNGSAPFRSCPFCTPARKKTVVVTLICPQSESPIKQVKMLKVLKCKCKVGPSND